MNILIPDRWLRIYLKTKATPEQIKEYLSLCGPSIERIYGEGEDTVYDIEITGNRPDAMSVMGVAREAATILPRFKIPARLAGDPYKTAVVLPKPKAFHKLTIKSDPKLNPRWMSVVFDSVTVAPSPVWLTRYLELSGIRSLNAVIDITNFLMRAYGQPAHVFDYDTISGGKMILRESKKGEKLTTLDGKSYTLPGGDIVIEDGSHTVIDLCGIMGGKNSSVKDNTKRIILFLQTYDPGHIRKTSMGLGIRTEAAALFEKGLDTELVKPVFLEGIRLVQELTGGRVTSTVTDLYPHPPKASTVSVSLSKIYSYIGEISKASIKDILTSLGFGVTMTKTLLTVTVPSFRRDVAIDVDVIEEIARVHGYHEIPAVLPDKAPPNSLQSPSLIWETEVKIRLRDWGYTECITYSMVSEDLMRLFEWDTRKAYKITNPLSNEWVYMRPDVFMSMIPVIRDNLKITKDLRLFELSMSYIYRQNDLPLESPMLVVVWGGNTFLEAKGLAEAVCSLFGLELPLDIENKQKQPLDWFSERCLSLGEFGSVGEIRNDILEQAGIHYPITKLSLDIGRLVMHAQTRKTYVPVPRYPPIVEDLSFVVPDRFHVLPLITAFSSAHELVRHVTLLDVHKNTRTFHITYQDISRNLTGDEIVPVRNKLIDIATNQFGATLKSL